MIKSFYSLLACAAFMLVGTYAGAQLSVEVWVNTDTFGYETYWALTDNGVACGVSDLANGGNAVVGCDGCGAQAATSADAGAYANNSTIVEGPYMIAAGTYDFYHVDDWDDGSSTIDIYVDGVLQHTIASGCQLPTTIVLAPIVDGCTDAGACNYDAAANNDDGSCFFPGDACDDGDAGTTLDVYVDDGLGGCVCQGQPVEIGCNDPAACNYNVLSIADDGSCVYATGCDTCSGETDGTGTVVDNPEVGDTCDDGDANTFDDVIIADCSCAGTPIVLGCTDDSGAACNYDPAANTDDGSCCYDDCVTLVVGGGTFESEMSFEFLNNGVVEAAGTTGTFTVCVDLLGCDYAIRMIDSFGDGWNGGTYTFSDPVSGDVYQTGTFTTGSEATDPVIFDAVQGCTDPVADNYDPLALCDDGSCSYCIPGQLTVVMSMEDTFGDGWNGATYTISDIETGALIAFGSLDFAQSGDGSSVGTDIFCLDPGCYNLEVGGGTFDGELVWSLDIDGGSNIYAGEGAFGPQGFILGSPGCDVAGCTDPICFNYNPYATTDDGSCVCPPDNDLCDGAEAVTCGSVVSGSTSLASDDILGTICSEEATGPGVWYQFDGNGDQVTASLCGSLYDTKIMVFSGTCAGLTCVGGNDDFCGLQSEFTWVSEAATDYYIYVTGFGTSTGDFTLTITCADCTGLGAGNDECVDATLQLSGVPFVGSLCCVNPEEADLCTPAFATPYGVWFVMNSGDFDTFDFLLENLSGSEIATTIFEDLGNLGCGNLVEIACGGPVTGTVGGDISSFYNLVPNTDYYFYVYTTDPAGCGDFSFVATTSYVGCTDPLACNYDATADIACADCCVYEDQVPVVASGFAPETLTEVVIDAGAEPCTDVTILMADTFGDGWNGATWEFFDVDGVTSLGTGTLDDGSAGQTLIGCFPSGTYYVSVGGGSFDGEISWDIAAGEVVICDPLLPDNDFCATAEDLSCGVTTTGSNSTALPNAPASADCNSPGAGVWYTFTGTGELHNINTCGSDVDTQVDIFVSDDNTCAGVFSCATDFITGDFLTEVDDADPVGGCGFFEADDVNLDFVDELGVVYFVYVSANGTGGAFTISHTCQPYTPGCTNDTACNYDMAATYDDGTCEWASCVCDAECPGTGFGLQFDMLDAFGDGWNGATYTITNGNTGDVVTTGSLDDALVFVDADNFAGPESGQDYFCICDAGCYVLEVTEGDFPSEISWTLNTADGVTNLLSGTTGTYEFSLGGAVCGCTDPDACNFDTDATVDNGTCEYETCAGCMDDTACNFDPEATYDDGTECCYDVCVTVVMTDEGFDGWEGGIWEIFSTDGTLQASGTLADGGIGEATACLLDAGCYYLNVSGGSTFEYGWALIGADGYTGTAVGEGAVTEFYFAVGGGECATCQVEYACNYDASGFFSDCDLCEYVSGCTYEDATNYDAAACGDDGSCIFELVNPCPTDLNGDGSTGTPDLLIFLGEFGTDCPTE